MIYTNIIGIDVSRDELIGVRINRAGREVEQYQLENATDTINAFLALLMQKHKHLVIACESTSDFHRELALCCLQANIVFRLINPITTQQFVKVTVRGRKTDMGDALIIAKLALHGEGRDMQFEDFSFTKSISRTASKLSEMERSLGKMIKRFKRINQESVEVDETLERCRKSLEIGMKQLRKHLHNQTDHTLQKVLISIPGVGPTIADILIAELGDINRFQSGKSLVAFAGLDPRVKQSGVSLKRNTRITKRGSPHLRHVLYFGAAVAQLHDREFKEHFLKKKDEGRSYTESTLSGARKLAYRIFAVWKRGTPYIVNS